MGRNFRLVIMKDRVYCRAINSTSDLPWITEARLNNDKRGGCVSEMRWRSGASILIIFCNCCWDGSAMQPLYIWSSVLTHISKYHFSSLYCALDKETDGHPCKSAKHFTSEIRPQTKKHKFKQTAFKRTNSNATLNFKDSHDINKRVLMKNFETADLLNGKNSPETRPLLSKLSRHFASSTTANLAACRTEGLMSPI